MPPMPPTPSAPLAPTAPPLPPLPPPPPPPPAAPTAAPAGRKRWRTVFWLLGSVLLLAALALSVGLWQLLNHHPAALPWLLGQVPGLTLQGLQGSWGSGRLQAASLRWKLPGQAGEISAETLVLQARPLRWLPHAGSWFDLQLGLLSAERVHYRSGPPSGKPLVAPADLHLPLTVQIDALHIGQLRIDDQPPIDQLDAKLALGAGQGALHRVDALSFTWQQALVQASGQIGTSAPLPVQAHVQARRQGPGEAVGRTATAAATAAATATAKPNAPAATDAAHKPGGLDIRSHAWAASVDLSGPLARLQADGRLDGSAPALANTANPANPANPAPRPNPAQTPPGKGGGPSLRAQATLLPFEAWPLGGLSLSTRQLDLSALVPGWPHTLLGGSAQVLTTGLDQPASAKITLDNQLPGRWDAGRLPVQRLVLDATTAPRHPQALTLDRFVLTLADANGPAGTVSGQGRWADGTLALDLRVADLQPDRLHHQAAAVVLGGPVQFKATGLGASASPVPVAGSGAGVTGKSANSANSAASAPGGIGAAGPTFAVTATLDGRLQDGPGPVKLHLVAQGNRSLVQVSQAQASAGPASAQASGQARAEPAGWRVKGQAKLDHFDPRPWWRGADSSAWRRGPHRLDAELALDLLWRNTAAGPAAAAPAQANPDLAPDPSAPWLERWLAALDGNANAQVHDSQVAGVALNGSLRLKSAGPGAELDIDATLAGNWMALQGQRAANPADDRWRLQIQAPALAALAPLGALAAELDAQSAPFWPSQGGLSGELQATGRWPDLRTRGDLQAQGLRMAVGSVQSATLGWQTGDNADAALSLKLQAQGLAGGDATGSPGLDSLAATLTGSLRSHTLDLRLDSPAKPPAWTENLLGAAGTGTRLQATGQGSWAPGSRSGGSRGTSTSRPGIWRVQGLQLLGGARDTGGGSRPWLAAQGLSAELQLSADLQPLALSLAPGRVQLLSTALQWREATWQAASAPAGTPRLTLVAELERFDVAALLARVQPTLGWGGDLVLGGRIDIRSAERLDADVIFERLAGDLTLNDDLGAIQSLGVTDLRLALTAHDGLWQFAQGVAGRSIGEMGGAQVLRTTADKLWPPADAPLQGVIESRVANLGIWGTWVPPGWRLAGTLRTSASFGGTRGAPEVRGEMEGSGLGLRNLLQGISLSDGDLALTLAGETARIERFTFKGGDGQLALTGNATLGAAPSATLHLAAERFRLLGRIDRRLVASGSADLTVDAQRLKLDGAFTVDEGLIDLSQGNAPGLDADVVVRRSAGAASAPAPARSAVSPLPQPLRQPQVALKINLGQKLRLRGHGVDTGLRGDLAVSSPDGKLALNGLVRAEGGTVAAYGQKLEIERGAVSFNGALDNPVLDVLAIRPNLDVKVGVLVTGLAQNPRIRLFSEPELADYDKLSWLVLGRSPDGLGRTDTALLQRAAFALLAGDGKSPTDALLESIGLTDFSVRQSDGDTRETIVSLGKQLSQRWYLGYERSVNATTGTWQLIYRLAQRFTLRAQSGADNAVDVIWSWRW